MQWNFSNSSNPKYHALEPRMSLQNMIRDNIGNSASITVDFVNAKLAKITTELNDVDFVIAQFRSLQSYSWRHEEPAKNVLRTLLKK